MYVVWNVRNSSWWLPALLCICCYTCFVMSCAVLVGYLVWSLWVVGVGGGFMVGGVLKEFQRSYWGIWCGRRLNGCCLSALPEIST